MTLQSSKMIFQALETSAASLTLVSSATSLASTASTALFSQKTSDPDSFYNPCHQNNQHRSLVVDWILKSPVFYWYLVPFLLEAVEASLCYFFENWLMKLKCPLLLKPLGTIIQKNYQSFYLSEPFTLARFKMRHPVRASCPNVYTVMATHKLTENFSISVQHWTQW